MQFPGHWQPTILMFNNRTWLGHLLQGWSQSGCFTLKLSEALVCLSKSYQRQWPKMQIIDWNWKPCRINRQWNLYKRLLLWKDLGPQEPECASHSGNVHNILLIYLATIHAQNNKTSCTILCEAWYILGYTKCVNRVLFMMLHKNHRVGGQRSRKEGSDWTIHTSPHLWESVFI